MNELPTVEVTGSDHDFSVIRRSKLIRFVYLWKLLGLDLVSKTSVHVLWQ